MSALLIERFENVIYFVSDLMPGIIFYVRISLIILFSY